MKNVMQAMNLPNTTSQSLTGDVKSNSIVPIFCSSAKRRIVRTGASQGSINIDTHSIKDVKLNSLRKQIAFVQQEVFLFSDSIFNNITLYDEHISINKVEQAAKQIGIHDFISTLPGGYNYSVGERGVTLSTGQRQLIAFLRVYVRNPKILILDEATSSIDTETEQLLQNALEKLAENRKY